MTINELASALAKTEGKNHQASIGDIRETLKLLVSLSSQIDVDVDLLAELSYLANLAFDKNEAKLLKKQTGGKNGSRKEAKVSKKNKIKGRGDGKDKRTGRGS